MATARTATSTRAAAAGQVSITSDESATGKVGGDLSVEEGYAAARLCGLNILAQLRAAVGDDIDRAKAIKLGGFVNAPPDFTGPPGVVNGLAIDRVELDWFDRQR